MKKVVYFGLLVLMLFSYNCVYAYEFYDANNEGKVNGLITDVYDRVDMYTFLAGEDVETPDINYTQIASDLYWWPIGSLETTEKNGKLFATGTPSSVNITSSFGSDEEFRTSSHKGLDIASSGNGVNYDNVIASKSGVVIYPTSTSQTNFADNGYYGNRDGGGYGNYIIIQHSDGNYTLYAHLAQGSINVIAGDEVEQGQVIAKLGNSGSSTGPHLHFEVRNGSEEKVNPLNYVSAEDPRPISVGGGGFSLTTTSFSKEEFVLKMNDYCSRTNHENFCNFAKHSEEIYEASVKNGVNPELVVVTAGTEQNFKSCGSTNNYWGIGISNGEGCSGGPHYANLSEGIAGYAKTISSYLPGGSQSKLIEERYYERLEKGADPNGIGLPGTFAGMQMVYSNLGDHEPGNSSDGGYYYMDPAVAGVTTIYSTHEEFMEKCYNVDGEHAEGTKVTAWEQSRYTIWQMEGKVKLRQKIFGI